jgi:hypothetical protein
MSMRSRLGARLWTAALVTAIPAGLGGFAQLAPSARMTSGPDALVMSSEEVLTASLAAGLHRQDIEPQTTIAGTLALGTRAERNREIKLSSTKGEKVWTASALSEHDVPAAAMRAYKAAAGTMKADAPGCRLPWTLLAGIGRVESDHGRYGGSTLGRDGVPRPAIVGVALNGVGPVAAIHDTDDGAFDGDTVWDRAVGPMQFIPSTWIGAGRDGDRDGVRSPNDIDDAALAAAAYLCHGGRDMTRNADVRAGIFSYNPSDYYVDLVSAFARGYRTGSFAIPSPEVDASDGDGVVHLRAEDGDQAARQGKAKAAAKKAASAKQAAKRAAKKAARKAARKKAQAAARRARAEARARAERDRADRDRAAASPGRKPTHTPAAPKPTPAPQPDKPKPTPKPTPRPTPTPTPTGGPAAPAGALLTAKGPVTRNGAGWSVGGVDLTVADLAGVKKDDWDGDGTPEPVAVELEGLVEGGQTATLTYYDKRFTVNGFEVG